jgi:hypothetical protein
VRNPPPFTPRPHIQKRDHGSEGLQATFGVEICDPQLDLVEFRNDGVSEINKIVGGWVGAGPDLISKTRWSPIPSGWP